MDPGLWPLPLSVELYPRLLYLNPRNFQIRHDHSSLVGPACVLLTEAFKR